MIRTTEKKTNKLLLGDIGNLFADVYYRAYSLYHTVQCDSSCSANDTLTHIEIKKGNEQSPKNKKRMM